MLCDLYIAVFVCTFIQESTIVIFFSKEFHDCFFQTYIDYMYNITYITLHIQVHKAKLLDGRTVAVKVQRPGMYIFMYQFYGINYVHLLCDYVYLLYNAHLHELHIVYCSTLYLDTFYNVLIYMYNLLYALLYIILNTFFYSIFKY